MKICSWLSLGLETKHSAAGWQTGSKLLLCCALLCLALLKQLNFLTHAWRWRQQAPLWHDNKLRVMAILYCIATNLIFKDICVHIVRGWRWTVLCCYYSKNGCKLNIIVIKKIRCLGHVAHGIWEVLIWKILKILQCIIFIVLTAGIRFRNCWIKGVKFRFLYKCQPCGGDCCLHIWSNPAFFCPEDASVRFLWNVCTNLPNYTASDLRRL
jgi:hypothetical protein